MEGTEVMWSADLDGCGIDTAQDPHNELLWPPLSTERSLSAAEDVGVERRLEPLRLNPSFAPIFFQACLHTTTVKRSQYSTEVTSTYPLAPLNRLEGNVLREFGPNVRAGNRRVSGRIWPICQNLPESARL